MTLRTIQSSKWHGQGCFTAHGFDQGVQGTANQVKGKTMTSDKNDKRCILANQSMVVARLGNVVSIDKRLLPLLAQLQLLRIRMNDKSLRQRDNDLPLEK